MRKIDPARFQVATRGTSRAINRRIALNLVRARQPISRADLARAMGVRRSAVSLIIGDLLKEGLVVEGATGEAGSRPSSTSTRRAGPSSRWTSARARRSSCPPT
jgi:predicted ArsR family transcriptional regulator